jgi:DNA invertase Pin-like site-specific DNA recombinase
MRDYRSCKRVFEEKASGGRWDRPELYKALEQLREGDVLVVWKLDRLSRSLKDLLHIMGRVRDAGAGFLSLTVKNAQRSKTVKVLSRGYCRAVLKS